MSRCEGGCLCGRLRFEVSGPPAKVTMCHCKFCQRATGSAYLIEPVFDAKCFSVLQGTPKQYTHVSEGSGKNVYIHFCGTCGTNIYLTFARFEGAVGVFGGTFDDPNWQNINSGSSKHIFLGSAHHSTVIPPHINTFVAHATENDGSPIAATVFTEPTVIKDM